MTEQTQRLARADAKVQTQAMSREDFCGLIDECEGTLYNVAVAMLGNRADCLDAMQDTVLAAWRGLAGLREPQYFKTWLTRILINQCKRTLRRRRLVAPLSNAMSETLSAPAPDEQAQALRAAVDALPERLRPVIVLYYYEDFAVEDIARALRVPRGTVKSRLSRGRDILRRSML